MLSTLALTILASIKGPLERIHPRQTEAPVEDPVTTLPSLKSLPARTSPVTTAKAQVTNADCTSSLLSLSSKAPPPPTEVYDFSTNYYETASRTADNAQSTNRECAWVTALPETLDSGMLKYISDRASWLSLPDILGERTNLINQCPGVEVDTDFTTWCPAEWKAYLVRLTERNKDVLSRASDLHIYAWTGSLTILVMLVGVVDGLR